MQKPPISVEVKRISEVARNSFNINELVDKFLRRHCLRFGIEGRPPGSASKLEPNLFGSLTTESLNPR
jgi:hypothetical protein